MPKIDESTNCLVRCCLRRVGKGVEERYLGVRRKTFWTCLHALMNWAH